MISKPLKVWIAWKSSYENQMKVNKMNDIYFGEKNSVGAVERVAEKSENLYHRGWKHKRFSRKIISLLLNTKSCWKF